MWTAGATSATWPAHEAEGPGVLPAGLATSNVGSVNLHDWIDELCDVLDVEAEIDEALVLDLARAAAHQVERPAAPITTYLLGYAAALHGVDPSGVEALAGKATLLANGWDKPAGAPDPDEVAVEVEIPDDSVVDHTADELEDSDF